MPYCSVTCVVPPRLGRALAAKSCQTVLKGMRRCKPCRSAVAGDVGGDGDDDTAVHQEGVESLSHKRGMAPYVFVPWDAVATSVLNLPIEQMDMYIAG